MQAISAPENGRIPLGHSKFFWRRGIQKRRMDGSQGRRWEVREGRAGFHTLNVTTAELEAWAENTNKILAEKRNINARALCDTSQACTALALPYQDEFGVAHVRIHSTTLR